MRGGREESTVEVMVVIVSCEAFVVLYFRLEVVCSRGSEGWK